jgi:hypothetical protein
VLHCRDSQVPHRTRADSAFFRVAAVRTVPDHRLDVIGVAKPAVR